MQHLLISVALALLLAFSTSAETYYVTPTASTPCPEEGVPCFTISKYAGKLNSYFAPNTTVILLPGNHNLDSKLWFEYIDSLIIYGNSTAQSNTSIACNQSAMFILNDIRVVRIRGLVLIGCMNNEINSVEQLTLEDYSLQGQGRNGTGLELNWVTSANIVRSSFFSSTGTEIINSVSGSSIEAGGAFIVRNSTVVISGSTFANNIVTGQNGYGGAVFAWSSHVTINTTSFKNNTVVGEEAGYGGAVFARFSRVTMNVVTFENNTVTGKTFSQGGAVHAWSGNVAIYMTVFTNNTAAGLFGKGGAVYSLSSNITVYTTIFTNNIATGEFGCGGALYTMLCSIILKVTAFDSNIVSGNFVQAGAVYVGSSDININITTFSSNNATGKFGRGGALYAGSSNIIVYTVIFHNNIAIVKSGSGGAMYTSSSHTAINVATFNNNTVTGQHVQGGAMKAFSSYVTVSISTFTNNTVTGDIDHTGGAVHCDGSSLISMHTVTFHNNAVTGYLNHRIGEGGAVYAKSSDITTYNTIFISNTCDNGIGYGGAVKVLLSNITTYNTTFNSNIAAGVNGRGGAVCAESSNVTIWATVFFNNSVTGDNGQGGAVAAYVKKSRNISVTVTIHNTTFNNNHVIGDLGLGGAVYTEVSCITLHSTEFNRNTITGYHGYGGAVSGVSSNIAAYNTAFNNNTATEGGGAMYIYNTTLNSTGFLDLQYNMADIGSTLYALQCTMYFNGNTTILNNYGSLYAYDCNVTFMGNTNIINNSYPTNTSQEGGAVTAIRSEIVFTGIANLSYNTAINGGAISAIQSKLHMYGDTTVAHNIACLSGGGIYAYRSELNLKNSINISSNSAADRGGGVHVISSTTRMTGYSKTYFVGNHAERGGGACLEMNAKLYIIKKRLKGTYHGFPGTQIRLEFIENSADYGGALYITDDSNSGTCHATGFNVKSTISSECFLQGLTLGAISHNYNFRNTYFANNSASKAGGVIYGGLLDRCTVNPYAEMLHYTDVDHNYKYTPSSLSTVLYFFRLTGLSVRDLINSTKVISSNPVRVCFCRDNQPDCSYHPQPMNVKKGETFTVSLVAADQINNTISNSKILTYLSAEAGLGEGQSIQSTREGCTGFSYTVTSSHTSEQLHLYADGPCKDIGISLQTINITFAACPSGFKDINSKCDCDPELNWYISNCSIDTNTVLRKDNVWIAFMNTSGKQSVVTYPYCPFDYCYPAIKRIRINVDIPEDSDKQCAFNRSGKLCGSCKDGLSLSLGSSHCKPCSNNWLVLLIVFAIAGIVLVALLLVCNLTVAAGTVNGLLFYANIFSSNQATFSPNSSNIFFTVFIAWLNLDFGFETCLFNGLNGYWKTWLQFVFPAYVIFLVILVIKACEYSSRFARLIARKNPVATLDTLVLLSYTKFIHTIISACQFATIEYSDGKREIVWLVDANIKYFELKHILLFVAALVIFMVALMYTLVIFLWQWLLLCPNRKPFGWIRNSRLHGIMDAYFITFNKNHRYWTGLLLLARLLLCLVSALSGVDTTDPSMNLLAISCVVGSLILLKEVIKGRIYRKWPLNILDTSFLFNLSILTAATIYMRDVGGNQAVVANTSLCIAFITFVLIISYHVYAFVLQNQVKKIKGKLFKNFKGNDSRNQQVQNVESGANNHDYSVTVVDFPLVPQDDEGDEIINGFDTNEEDKDSLTSLTTDNNYPTIKSRVEECQSQIELEDFIDDSSIHATYSPEVKGEESNTSDYDELAPLLR